MMRRILRPVLSPVDGRVADINRRIERRGAVIEAEVGRLSDAVGTYANVSSDATSYVGIELRRLDDSLRQLDASLSQVRDGLSEMDQRVLEAARSRLEEHYRARLSDARHLQISGLDEPLALLINHAAGHLGFAAQANLWFNDPLSVELMAGGARLTSVNERIVEVPFAMGVLSRLTPPARVLDIGSAESTFPLSAASLGYKVTAVEPRGLPYRHPNLQTAALRFEDWPPPTEPFSAAFLISTVEHVGLPTYGLPSEGRAEPGDGADHAMVQRIRSVLAPDGLLILTTPCGIRHVDDFQRTYDEAALTRLLRGWKILERRTVVRCSDVAWLPDCEPGDGHGGVALIVATPHGD